ncbi:MAG: SEC-C domain-containing protein [Alphaproteobacteria bacterium]|nr:SEC-C domain-containing protein [Alphaproteobacteria bacterium]
MESCPCGSGQSLDTCCGPILDGGPAPSPEALMRSRYSALALRRVEHLVETLTPEAREQFDRAQAETMITQAEWSGLDIRAVEGDDQRASVEFLARFTVRGEARSHHERAAFRFEDGRWLCAGGTINPKGPPRHVEKVGRNDPCPCGSGAKFKKCCG